MNDDDRREVELMIKEAALNEREMFRSLMTEMFEKYVGEQHESDHEFIREFVDFFSRSRRTVVDVILKSIVTFIILAFAAGFVMLVKAR